MCSSSVMNDTLGFQDYCTLYLTYTLRGDTTSAVFGGFAAVYRSTGIDCVQRFLFAAPH